MVLCGLFFFGLACNSNGWQQYFKNPWVGLISGLIMIVAMISGIDAGCQASSLSKINLWYPFIFISGIITIFCLSHYIKDTTIGKITAHIGNYSFSIMALHFLGFKIVTAIHLLIDSSVNLMDFPISLIGLSLWSGVYLIVGIIFPIVCSLLYSKIKNAWRNYCCLQKPATSN